MNSILSAVIVCIFAVTPVIAVANGIKTDNAKVGQLNNKNIEVTDKVNCNSETVFEKDYISLTTHTKHTCETYTNDTTDKVVNETSKPDNSGSLKTSKETKPKKNKSKKIAGLVEGNTYRMRIYHYCSCRICTKGTGITASGKTAKNGMVAMYGVPFGTIIEIDGNTYVVEDRGVGRMKVDIFVEEGHSLAKKFGTYMKDVKIVSFPKESD